MSQLSSQIKCSVILPEYKWQKSISSSQGDIWPTQLTGVLDESLSISSFMPSDVLPVCVALATMMQSISCQQDVSSRRGRQNLTQTIKTTEIFMDLCGLHSFILPKAFAQQKPQLFYLEYETHGRGKKGFVVLPFFWFQEHLSLKWAHLLCPCLFLAYTGINLFCFSSVQPIPQSTGPQ